MFKNFLQPFKEMWDMQLQVAQSEDYLLSSHANCPKFEELHAQVLEGQVMKTIYLENEEMFR